MSKGIGGHQSAANRTDEWLTPPPIVNSLGSFELDPCSPIKRPWDTATHHYTIIDDGLKQPWDKTIYLNFGKFVPCGSNAQNVSAGSQQDLFTAEKIESGAIPPTVSNASPRRFIKENLTGLHYYPLTSNDAQSAKLINHVTILILLLEKTKKHFRLGAENVNATTQQSEWQLKEATLLQQLRFWLQRINTADQNVDEDEKQNIVLSAITSVEALYFNGQLPIGKNVKATLEINVLTAIPVQYLHKIIIFLYQVLTAPEHSPEISCLHVQSAIPQSAINIQINGANLQLLSKFNDILHISFRLVHQQRVWLNPPYGAECVRWVRKLAGYGNGIGLIFARTETEMFFDHVWNKADSVFFFEGRLFFYTVAGKIARANAGAPSCLIAYGDDNSQAIEESGLKGKHVPLKYTPMVIVGISPSWTDVIKIVLTRSNGEAQVQAIYEMVREIAPDKVSKNPNYKEKIRQKLQQHFNRKERGTYTLFN